MSGFSRRVRHVLLWVAGGLLVATMIGGCRPGGTATPIPASPAPLASPLQSPLPLPGLEGQLLFHSNRAGSYDIYRLDLATGEISQLTNAPENEVEPAISPDGRQIVYGRARLDWSGQDLYLMNVDGTDQRLLLSMDGIATSPAWSPDGSQIVFYVTQAGHFRIFVVSSDGGEPHQLIEGTLNDMMPAWSPDGTQIVFTSDRGGYADLYLANADGSNLRRLTDSVADEWRARWSPDGRTIVFQGNETGFWQLYLLDVNSGEIEQLTEGDEDSEMPFWSGDGRFIYYTRGTHGETERFGLYVLDLERRESHPLTMPVDASDRYPVWMGE